MDRVHDVVMDLKPVAREPESVGHHAVVGLIVSVVDGKLGLFVRWSEVGEYKPLVFERRISTVTQGVLELAVGRLTRGLEDAAIGIKQPAVVTAAQAAFRNDAVLERCAAMAAMPVENTDVRRFVPEGHEILAQDANGKGQIGKLLRQAYGKPKPPHEFAHGRPSADEGEFGIGFRHLAQVVSGVWLCPIPGRRNALFAHCITHYSPLHVYEFDHECGPMISRAHAR